MLTILNNWYQHAITKSDPLEIEQAIIRIVVELVVLTWIIVLNFNHPLDNQTFILTIGFIIIVLSLLLIVAIVNNTFNPVIRRLSGAWLDITATSVFMSLTSDVGVMLVAIYLWVIFGNGFRYGNRYLYHAQLLSIIGFIVVSNVNPYWQTHTTIVQSLIAMLVILPLYVAKLISRLHEATQKAEIEREKAAEANSAKTRFVANMSHEIRTPLNGIIGISTLFKSTPLSNEQLDLLKTLESSSKLLLSLLNNVLDFTRIEERKLHIEFIGFSIQDTINDTVEIFKVQSHAKGIDVVGNISNKLIPVKGDVVVLRQVLANLMGNAIKFTEKGTVTINVTLMKESAHHATVRFEVTDTGIGIPANMQNKVFESFTQADASTTRKFGGSGLGLTIAKDMIEAMGGELKLQSTEGVGTRFWFDLSLEKDKLPASSTRTLDKPYTTRDISYYALQKPLNILVCEDETTNQKIIVQILSLPGHLVSVVESSEDMLDMLESQRFDLVITDLNMAGMSGIDALKLYRFTQPTEKQTRFILFTADATPATKQSAHDAGFDAILTKPIEALTLYQAIESALRLPANIAHYWINNVLNVNRRAITETVSETVSIALDKNTLSDLEKIGAGDDLFMHRVLKNYIADSSEMIGNITTATQQRNYGELQALCHALKGNSLSVGAIKLALSIEQLSQINSATTTDQAEDMLKTINNVFSQLTIAVEHYLKHVKEHPNSA
jgi:two-component system, sensor histidine kinase RpfC